MFGIRETQRSAGATLDQVQRETLPAVALAGVAVTIVAAVALVLAALALARYPHV